MLSGQHVSGVGHPPLNRRESHRTPSTSRGGNMGTAGPTISMFVSLRQGGGGVRRRRSKVRWLLSAATSGGSAVVAGPATRNGYAAQTEEITSALRAAATELEIVEEFTVTADPSTVHLGTVTLSATRETCGALERALKARFLFVPVEGAELRVSTRIAARPGRQGDYRSPREVRKLERVLSSRDAVLAPQKLRNGCAEAVSAIMSAIRDAARQHRIDMRTLQLEEQAVQLPAEPGAEPAFVGTAVVAGSLESIRTLERALKARFVVARVK